jgi:hypothetical protein
MSSKITDAYNDFVENHRLVQAALSLFMSDLHTASNTPKRLIMQEK